MKVIASMLGEEIHEEGQLMPPEPPSDAQAILDARRRTLHALDARIATLSEMAGSGTETTDPERERRALKRLLAVGVRKEADLAKDLDEDPWDVAAWCDQAVASGLIEQMATAAAPKRHWKISDQGRATIGYPSGR